MRQTAKRMAWVCVFAIAMALLEAVVVVYIRGLISVTGDRVSLGPYLRIEIGREIATLVMLVAIGWLAGISGTERLAYGLLAFGVWDIGYYAWLKVLIDWPSTLLDLDLLFMVPFPWWGPVLSPALVAALICANAGMAIVRIGRARRPAITLPRVGLVLLGGFLALYVFMSDSLHAFLREQPNWRTLRPGHFNWPLFLLALLLMALPSLTTKWLPRRTAQQA